MSSESLTEEIETAEEDDTDYDSRPSKGGDQYSYSEDFNPIQTSLHYSDDFESTAHSLTPGLYSAREKCKRSDSSPRPTPRPRRSINTSLTRSYSEDFESDSVLPNIRSIEAGTPTLLDVQTARSGYSVSFTDDLEHYSRTPRRAVRARTAERLKTQRSLELLTTCSEYSEDFESFTKTARTPRTPRTPGTPRASTARSRRSTVYSDDFERVTDTTKGPDFDPRLSTDTLYSYTQTFDSDEDLASEVDTTISTGESQESDRQVTFRSHRYNSESDADTITEVSEASNRSSYSYTDDYTQSYTETDFTQAEMEVARRQFVMHKLSVLAEKSSQKQSAKPGPHKPKAAPIDKQTAIYYKKLIKAVKKNQRDYHSMTEEVSGKTRRHLSEKDESNIEDFGISLSVLNRLRTENAIGRMKKFTNEEIHVPSTCPKCRDQVTAMAIREFARKKKTLVEAKMIQDRIEDNQYLYGDVVALMGKGVLDLPQHTANRKEIMDGLLKPWSSKLWGSKALKVKCEKEDIETTSRKNCKRLRDVQHCPHMADINRGNDENSEKSETTWASSSNSIPSTVVEPFIELDKLKTSQSETNKEWNKSLFDIHIQKLENVNKAVLEDVQKRAQNRGSFPGGDHWDEVRSRLNSYRGEPERQALITATTETLPVGLDIPTEGQRFWRHYFAPLKSCSWFPN